MELGRDRPLEEQIETSKQREEEIRELKESRNKSKTKTSLENLWDQAEMKQKKNLVPAMISALRADATLEEIIGTVRQANGYKYDPFGMIEHPFK